MKCAILILMFPLLVASSSISYFSAVCEADKFDKNVCFGSYDVLLKAMDDCSRTTFTANGIYYDSSRTEMTSSGSQVRRSLRGNDTDAVTIVKNDKEGENVENDLVDVEQDKRQLIECYKCKSWDVLCLLLCTRNRRLRADELPVHRKDLLSLTILSDSQIASAVALSLPTCLSSKFALLNQKPVCQRAVQHAQCSVTVTTT